MKKVLSLIKIFICLFIATLSLTILKRIGLSYNISIVAVNIVLLFMLKDDIKTFKFNIKTFLFLSILIMLISIISYLIYKNTKGINLNELFNYNERYKILIAVILTSMFEELIFRGIIQGILVNEFGFLISAIVISVVFTLLHEKLITYPLIFVLSMFFCYIRHKKNLIYSVYTHILYNLLITIL